MDNHIRCLCLPPLVCSDFINVYVCVSSYLFIHLGNFDSFSFLLSCHRQADIHTFICSTVQCLQMCDQADPGLPHLLSGELAFFQDACHIFLYLFLRAQTLVAMLAGYVIWPGLVWSAAVAVQPVVFSLQSVVLSSPQGCQFLLRQVGEELLLGTCPGTHRWASGDDRWHMGNSLGDKFCSGFSSPFGVVGVG